MEYFLYYSNLLFKIMLAIFFCLCIALYLLNYTNQKGVVKYFGIFANY